MQLIPISFPAHKKAETTPEPNNVTTCCNVTPTS
jgi:hypothetical protein